jgi:hypothetical protein
VSRTYKLYNALGRDVECQLNTSMTFWSSGAACLAGAHYTSTLLRTPFFRTVVLRSFLSFPLPFLCLDFRT